MNNMEKKCDCKKEMERLSAALKRLLAADFIYLETEGLCEQCAEIFLQINKLSAMLKEVFEFSRQLSQGKISIPAPPRSNFLAAGLKIIHSQLLHISWQAEQITSGDYSQRIDFMGDFGSTFNWAVENIQKRHDESTANQAMLLGLFNSLHSVIILVDAEDGRIVFKNKGAEAVCENCRRLDDGQNGLRSHINKLYKEFSEVNDTSVYFDNTLNKWFKIVMAKITWMDKNVILFSCVDVTEEQKELEKIKESSFDALTGLYLRNQGIPKVEDMFREIAPGCSLCIVFFDLDGLKSINDTCGHAAGDILIKKFSDILKKTFRSQDILIRMGGDEFVAAFVYREEKTINDILRRLANNAEKQNAEDDFVQVEYSQGYSAVVGKDITIAAAIEAADAAMYEHKKARKAEKLN